MQSSVRDWFEQRSYKFDAFARIGQRLKNASTTTLVLPTNNVARTIGPILSRITELRRDSSLVDQIIVADADSTDGTPDIARRYGVEVYSENDLMSHYGKAKGKGDALWRSLSVAKGDIVKFSDTDTPNFAQSFVYGILGTLLTVPGVIFVKAAYSRPFATGSTSIDDGGGRVTELTAKPLINFFYPELAGFVQPLAGEFAAHRNLLSSIPFLTGYGVDIGILIDTFRSVGLYSMAQVDLGVRENRHQALMDLNRMSHTIMCAVTHRLNLQDHYMSDSGIGVTQRHPLTNTYFHAKATNAGLRLDNYTEDLTERPPMIHVKAQA